jgi:hypothetical protein
MKRSRILYFLLFFMSLCFVYFYGGKLPYMFFFTTITLPIISFSIIFIIFIRFKYIQDIDKNHIIKGEKINFIFNVNNEDIFLYPYLIINFHGSDTIFFNQFQSQRISIEPYRRTNYSFELECKYRGSFNIGVKSIEIEDFLGIFKLTYKAVETKSITVYPKITYLEKFYLKTNYLSESHSILDTKLEDLTTVSDIRKYAYGDTLKRIHWKLSAKKNELVSKNFQSTSQISATIFLDLKKLKFSMEHNTIIEDKLIDSVGAVIYYCLSHLIPINFIFYSDKIINIEAKSLKDFDEIYKILAKIRFIENIPIYDIMDVYFNDFLIKSNVLVFTADLNYKLYNEIYKNKFSGNEMSLIYISPEELTGEKNIESDNILLNLPEINVLTYKMNISDDVKIVLENSI